MLEAMLLKYALDYIQAQPTAKSAPNAPAIQAQRNPQTSLASSDNFADAMRAILKCYHKTAKFSEADVVQTPWPRQMQYGADRSALVRINFTGLSSKQYSMLVAVMARKSEMRAHLVQDNAVFQPSRKCGLDSWSSTTATPATKSGSDATRDR